jgi:hypothetical protein
MSCSSPVAFVSSSSILLESYSIYSFCHVLSTFESCSIYYCSHVRTIVGDFFFKLAPDRFQFYLLSTVGVIFWPYIFGYVKSMVQILSFFMINVKVSNFFR